MQGKQGKKTVPSFVTPAAVRDQVDFLKGNLDQNLVDTFLCQFFGRNCGRLKKRKSLLTHLGNNLAHHRMI